MLGTLDKAVERKRRGRESLGRDDKAVKFDRTLADKAGFVCSRRRLTLAEYLSELCRSEIERDFQKEASEIKTNEK